MDIRLSDEGVIYIDCSFFKSYPVSILIKPENIQSLIDAIKRIEKLLILK